MLSEVKEKQTIRSFLNPDKKKEVVVTDATRTSDDFMLAVIQEIDVYPIHTLRFLDDSTRKLYH